MPAENYQKPDSSIKKMFEAKRKKSNNYLLKLCL